MDESMFREKVALEPIPRATGGKLGDKSLTEADDGSFRCHRGRLEQMLQEGQNIKWSKTVQAVETSPQGIIVRLGNESIESRVLIGADGVHSQVRKSLVPEIELKVLPFVVFNGKRCITHAEYQDYFVSVMQNQTVIQSRQKDTLLQVSIGDHDPETVEVRYTYSRPARQDDPLHKPDRAVLGATDVPKEFYTELQGLEDLAQPFRLVFDSSKVKKDRVLHWLMRSTIGSPAQAQDLAKQGVLLVGDAIHAMPILGGEGANHALKDGVDLAYHIARHGTGTLQAFTEAKYEAWEKGVEESEKRLGEMHHHANASL
ncbi:MAG: hypothetical protein Q9190_002768 [Brigantiaea leucoxantha]